MKRFNKNMLLGGAIMSASRGIEANESVLNREIEGRHPGLARSADPGSHNRRNFAIADQVRNDVTSLPSYLPTLLPFKRAAFTKPSRATKIAKQSERRVCVNGNVEFSLQTRAVAFNARRSFARCAFTLAEVLITLVIVGVVAVLTIAPLITKYEKHRTIVQLKAFYSLFSNVVRMSEEEYGPVSQWDLSLSEKDFYQRYLKKNLIIVKECLPNSGSVCSNIARRDLTGSTANLVSFGGSPYSNRNLRFILNNGNLIAINSYSNSGKSYSIHVDLNGDKKPNRSGRDVFTFVISKDGFHPYSHYGYYQRGNRYDMKGAYGGCNVKACCSRAGAGGGCSQMIFYDKWQIKDDYPW